MKITSVTVGLIACLASLAQAYGGFWRMECPGSTYAQMDPLVDTGRPSDHLHAISGGNNFGLTTTYDDLRQSQCTSCRILDDLSAYWVPTFHFVHDDGTVELVPQDGGMIVYYFVRGANVTAFPDGFRMLAGDSRMRNFAGPFPDKATSSWDTNDRSEASLRQKALGFNCLNYASGHNEDTLYRHTFPQRSFLDSCVDGLRLELAFPSCWNGKDLDSGDHKSHVAYPSVVQDGACPDGFSTRLPTILYEVKWRTDKFAGKSGKFTLSNGDTTGCGYHGDFINGWKKEALEAAIQSCPLGSGMLEECSALRLQSLGEAAKCKIKVPDAVPKFDSAKAAMALPNNVPLQDGPGYASKLGAAVSSILAPIVAPIVAPTSAAAPAPPAPTPNTKKPETKEQAKPSKPLEAAPVVAAEVSTSVAAPSPPAVPSPATTPPPAAVPEPETNPRIKSTTTYTSDGAVWVVAIEEVEVTITQTSTVLADDFQKHKRHIHGHNHVHARHHRHHYGH